jgi:hypothetical protein
LWKELWIFAWIILTGWVLWFISLTPVWILWWSVWYFWARSAIDIWWKIKWDYKKSKMADEILKKMNLKVNDDGNVYIKVSDKNN